jgi:hypothetical protein
MAVKRKRPARLSGATAQSAPLAAAAPSTRIAATKLEIRSAYEEGLLVKSHPQVGVKARVSILFYDAITKDPAAPTTPKLVLTKPDSTKLADIAMTEDSTQDGRFTASFIPAFTGEWKLEITHGSPVEIGAKTKFYVGA